MRQIVTEGTDKRFKERQPDNNTFRVEQTLSGACYVTALLWYQHRKADRVRLAPCSLTTVKAWGYMDTTADEIAAVLSVDMYALIHLVADCHKHASEEECQNKPENLAA